MLPCAPHFMYASFHISNLRFMYYIYFFPPFASLHSPSHNFLHKNSVLQFLVSDNSALYVYVGYLHVTDTFPSLLFCQHPLFLSAVIYGLHPNLVPGLIRHYSGQSLVTQNQCYFLCQALAALCYWHLRGKLLYFGRRNWFLLSANSTNQESSLEVTFLQLASQIPRVLWNLNVHCCVHSSTLFVCIPNQMIPVETSPASVLRYRPPI